MQRRTVSLGNSIYASRDSGEICYGDLVPLGIRPRTVFSTKQVRSYDSPSGIHLLPICVADAIELWNHSIKRDREDKFRWGMLPTTTTTNFAPLTKTEYLNDIVMSAYREDIERESNAKDRRRLSRKLRKHNERARQLGKEAARLAARDEHL